MEFHVVDARGHLLLCGKNHRLQRDQLTKTPRVPCRFNHSLVLSTSYWMPVLSQALFQSLVMQKWMRQIRTLSQTIVLEPREQVVFPELHYLSSCCPPCSFPGLFSLVCTVGFLTFRPCLSCAVLLVQDCLRMTQRRHALFGAHSVKEQETPRKRNCFLPCH